nr:integrase, catalytic region, zinc finger, CCHC-type, peptidase aspartic, catalytic [Tanacetum cinerariifolium]
KVTNLQCDYLELLEKCECLENELSKSKMMSKSFEALWKHAINLEIDLQQCQEKIKNDNSFKENLSKEFRKEREQYFEIQDLKAQLQDKGIVIKSNQKPRNITRKLYEHISKACSWWYPKFTPSGYKWKPKSGKENVNPNVSMPLRSLSRTANILECMTSRRSTVSNTPLSSNSFAARRDCPIHRRLWCSKHITENLKLLITFVEKFLGTVKFGNDQIAPILGYGDLVQGAVTIKRVY